MALPNDVERDVDAIRLPRWGRVVETGGVVPYEVHRPGPITVRGLRPHPSELLHPQGNPHG